MLSRGDECGWEKGLPIMCIVACQGKDSLWTPCSCTCLFHDADSNTLPTLAHSPTQHNQGLISRLHDASKMAISFQEYKARYTLHWMHQQQMFAFQIDRASAVTSARKICDRYLPMFWRIFSGCKPMRCSQVLCNAASHSAASSLTPSCFRGVSCVSSNSFRQSQSSALLST